MFRWPRLQFYVSLSGAAVFCENAARKYYDYSDKTLAEMFRKSAPYKNASKEHNDGKWNKEIDDRDIYSWKNQTAKKTNKA